MVLAYFVANPLLGAVKAPFARINLPLGMAAMFLGVFTVVVRREAVPQLLGLLAVENGVFFAGIAIVPDLPVIAELAAAVDVPVVASVVGLLVAAHSRARGNHRRRPAGMRCGSVEAMELAAILIIAGCRQRPFAGAARPPPSPRRSLLASAVIVLALAIDTAMQTARAGHLDALEGSVTCDGLGALILALVALVGTYRGAVLLGLYPVALAARRPRREQRTTSSTISSSSRCSRCRCWPTSP